MIKVDFNEFYSFQNLESWDARGEAAEVGGGVLQGKGDVHHEVLRVLLQETGRAV